MTNQDTEITLGTGRLLGLFFGLVLLCAVFFALGYGLGHKSATTAAAAGEGETPPPVTSASGVKPGAVTQAVASKPDCATTAEGCEATGSPETQSEQDTGSSTPPDATGNLANGTAPANEQPAVPSAPEVAKPGSGYIVQVAAVSKQQDAEALVEALKKKQYPVFTTMAGTDSLFHVQIGPFAEQKDAEAIRSRLVADGYNPIVKR